VGLDGHDVGAKYVSRLLRDNGFEVIFLGIRQLPESVVRAAVDEDVDVIGLSVLSGSHLALVGRVLELLRAEHAEPVPVVVGGVIPPDDHDALRALGVSAVFNAGTPVASMVEQVRALAAEWRGGQE
jgi:methylmalonyl-CoA mutase C-terminal domain/subunit